jgi:dsDNA-specific endonuclease/ATPase MutS2
VDDSSILNMKLLNWLRDLGRPTASAQDDNELDPDDPFPEPVEIEITDVIDLHTIQPREVKLGVEEYLHQARELGFQSVRIIHGKGIGVQREMVHSILAKTPFVLSWTDAPAEAGGWGATIVRLRIED